MPRGFFIYIMLQIKKEFKDLIPALLPEEFSQLETNCIQHGIQDSIKVWNNYVIDGHNRYEIAQKHKLKFEIEELHFENELKVREWMILNQFGRRNLSNYQRSILALQLEDVFKEKAKENLKLSQGKGKQKSAEVKVEPIETRKELAKVAQVSHDTIAKVKHIEQKASPEVKAKLNTGEVSINQVYQEIKKEEKKIEREEYIQKQKNDIESGTVTTVSGLYNIISMDPPWPYGRTYDPQSSRVANPYPEMSIEAIKSIKAPFEKDAVLFLWTTHAFLPDAFDILKEWNFEYKATIVWNKMKIGMGAWFRMQCEFCLVGIKGKPFWQNTKFPEIIEEARREHSRKPDAFFELVNQITAGKKLEYFSREKRINWDNYGNETEKF